jgi:hypothetical protein
MRRPLIVAAVALLGLAPAARAEEIPVDHLSVPVPHGREVRVDFPVGTFQVEASDQNQVVFELNARCRGWWSGRCEDRARRIHIESEDHDGTLRLSVEGYPKMNAGGLNLHGVLRVPRDLALHLEMGVGDLDVRDMEGDLHVELGVGDADIRSPGSAVRSVDVSTGVGDADVRTRRGGAVRRHSFISSTASWDEGRGRSEIHLKVGVGDATVRVD